MGEALFVGPPFSWMLFFILLGGGVLASCPLRVVMKIAVGGNKVDSVNSAAAGFTVKSLHPLFSDLVRKPCKPF